MSDALSGSQFAHPWLASDQQVLVPNHGFFQHEQLQPIDVTDEPTKEPTMDANEEPTGPPVSAASTLAFNMMVALLLVVGVAML
jgi:hypothetical protein